MSLNINNIEYFVNKITKLKSHIPIIRNLIAHRLSNEKTADGNECSKWRNLKHRCDLSVFETWQMCTGYEIKTGAKIKKLELW